MRYIIVGIVMIMYGFVWVFCLASKQDIGIDELEEQDNWMREYEKRKQEKTEKCKS